MTHLTGMDEKQEPTAAQCWAAERMLGDALRRGGQSSGEPIDPLTVDVRTDIDPDQREYGYGGELYPAPTHRICLSRLDSSDYTEIDLGSDFDLEAFVEECIVAKARWRERR